MTEKEKLILSAIRQNPLISQKELGQQSGMSREAVAHHIMNLTRKGFIRGKGYLLNNPLEVLVIGGCNLDIQGIPLQHGQAGDSLPGTVTMTPGGVGRNIAENLARLGHQVRLISAVGEDDAGKQLIQATRSAGVDTSSIKAFSGFRSPVYLSVLDPEHELLQAINDMSVTEQMTPEFLAGCTPDLHLSQALIIDTNLSEATLTYLFQRQDLPPVFADCVSAAKAERLKPWLHRIHTLKPNRMEASLLWGQEIQSEADLPACANWFHEQGISQLFISLGEEGLYASRSDEQVLLPPEQITVASVAGAGDALMAGLVHSWINHQPLVNTARIAQACACLALEHHGTNNPALSAETIEQRINA
ncbi:PfkB family carbohydrate kinase [Parendozoicomonas haliclonae]|uniref:Pseudouridine kinase n=1 Tax=Parendozoicomonas haliclonae TaxID=1960125 RepID=A0A1X7AP28_9GAMM|nr:PfkB family carbohydrate kinase [Parendozoicomonas haliclonae]SMA49858.1 Pseudouridine kinase [Parendozoicomonas haliclonae]